MSQKRKIAAAGNGNGTAYKTWPTLRTSLMSWSSTRLGRRMLRDIRAGKISPAATPSSLARRYGMKSQKRMIAAMQEACRQHEMESGRMMVAIDDDTGHILRSFALPVEFCERIETFALRVAILALDPHGQSPGKTFNEQGEICLHVYVMPRAAYRKRQGASVKAVGTHVFTFRTWDKTVEEVDAPFPEDRPISREVTGWYSPGVGYQGFDGQNWRSDWFTYDPPEPTGKRFVRRQVRASQISCTSLERQNFPPGFVDPDSV